MEKKDLKKNVWWLSATSFLTDVSSEMIFPILPIFMKSVLGAPLALIGFIEGLAEGLGSILKYFSGYFSDKIHNRRKLTLWGYSLSAMSKLAFALAHNVYTVLAFRSLDRIGKGIRTSPRDALIADSVSAKERGKYFGLHRTADTAGAVIGTIIAIAILFYLEENISGTIRLILFLSFVPAIFGALLLFNVKEVEVTANGSKVVRKLFDFGVVSKRFKIFLVIAGLFGLANYSYAFYILRADEIKLNLFLIPVVYLLYNIFYAASAFPAGQLSDYWGRRPVLLAAFGLFAVINLAFAFAATTITIWFLFAFYGLFIGLTDGVFKAFVADLAAQERRGEAFGLYHMIVGLATLLGNFIGGGLWQLYGAAWPFTLSAVFISAAGVILLVFFGNHSQLKSNFLADSFKGYRG